MEFGSSEPPRAPLLLLGRRGPSLTALADSPSLQCFFKVATPRNAEVAPLVRVLRPAAVLLEGSEYYLDGRKIHSTLKGCSPETRVLFLDLEGPWALWMEMESEETRDLRIEPCEAVRAGAALLDLLKPAGLPEPRLAASA
jgi:hypothetical protein